MGGMLDGIFGRSSRQVTKLKFILGLIVTRLAILRNYRHARCAHAQADVANLLQLGHQDRALLRVEMVIKERNMLDVLAMVENYCNLLIERAFLLQNQKECPEELREAAAGLSFAATRCGDIPELREVRRIFSSRFGNGFTLAAAELRNNCGVSGKMVQKFSTKQPGLETRVKVTKEIAKEKGIKVELADPHPDTTEMDPKPRVQSKNQAKVASPEAPLAAARFLQELLGDENLAMSARAKYKDAGSAAQAAFESAAYAAVAARTAVELYLSENRDSSDPGKPFIKLLTANTPEAEKDLKLYRNRDDDYPSDSSFNCVDIGCRKYKVSSVRIESEKSRGKGILCEESDDEIEELEELISKALVPVNKPQSFPSMRDDSKAQTNYDADYQKRSPAADEVDEQSTLREKMDKLAIVAVDPPKRSRHNRHNSVMEVGPRRLSDAMERTSSFSVRTRR